MNPFNMRSQPNYCFSKCSIGVHTAKYTYNSMLFNPTTNDDYSCHRNSAECYQLAQSVLDRGVSGCTSTVLADSAAASDRKGLVSAGWPVLLLSCTNERRKWSFHLVGAPFLAF